MDTVDIDEVKANLSQLVEQAARGESFFIASAGKPLVKVIAVGSPIGEQVRRIGFLTGEISVPDDFDRMGSEAIEHFFGA